LSAVMCQKQLELIALFIKVL